MSERLSTGFGFRSEITNENAKVTGPHLPTSLQVLDYLMYHLNDVVCMNHTR